MRELNSALINRVALAIPIALAGLFASANAYGTEISLGANLTNASFEMGNQSGADPFVNGCPVAWTCVNTGGNPPGVTSYVVTGAQYVAGSDGLVGSLITPDGTQAASSPTPDEGSGGMMQNTSLTYVAGNTYSLDLYMGTPLTLPIDGTTPVAAVQTARVYLLVNGSPAEAIDFPTIPAPGQWSFDQLVFDPTGATVGGTIGIEFFVVGAGGGGSGNNLVANFDITPGGLESPEPSSFALFGLGLAGFAAVRRMRSKA